MRRRCPNEIWPAYKVGERCIEILWGSCKERRVGRGGEGEGERMVDDSIELI